MGTKLKLAFETGIHDTIGIDLVRFVSLCMCVFFVSNVGLNDNVYFRLP